MIEFHFEGYWQCRFATDPDPADEPRGLTGPTFATHSEPDLDRIIRTNDPVTPRFPHEDQVGVRITHVSQDGAPTADDHPFVGGRFDFIEDPQFVQLNWIITPGFKAPIDPLHIQLTSRDGSIVLRRRDEWVLSQPGLTIYDIFTDDAVLKRRDNTYEIRSAEVAEATGIIDYAGYRRDRRATLDARLRQLAADDPERADLQQRIANLDRDATQQGVTFGAQQFLGMKCDYDISINGEVSVDGQAQLGKRVSSDQYWRLAFWMGGYDTDLMTGYVKGSVTMPMVD